MTFLIGKFTNSITLVLTSEFFLLTFSIEVHCLKLGKIRKSNYKFGSETGRSCVWLNLWQFNIHFSSSLCTVKGRNFFLPLYGDILWVLSDEQCGWSLLSVLRSCSWSILLFVHHGFQTSRKKEAPLGTCKGMGSLTSTP